jgi:DNA-binding transcriptional LysR family regulator
MPTAFGRLHIAPYIDSFLARYPEIELHVSVSDAFVDIIREGFDLAIRIGELEDSSLVARRLAPDTRVLCAAPAYIEKHGLPASIVNLEAHNCLVADATETWKLSGPEGDAQVRPYGTVRSDSGEVIRELVLSGVGIGLLSIWDIGPALRSGALRLVLPAYRGTVGWRRYMRSTRAASSCLPKVDVLIEFLAELYGTVPYWEREIDIDKLGARQPARGASRRIGKAAVQAVAPR